MVALATALIALTLSALAPPAVLAAAGAGTVVALEGTVEIALRDAPQSWRAVALGAPVGVGDRIRTGEPGRVRIAFDDDSTLNVGAGSEIVVGEHLFAPDQGAARTVLHLLKGKIRALVSEYYQDPLASFDVETATAVSGVRGTDFIVVAGGNATEVVALSGRVAVHSVLDRTNRGVVVTANMMTRVPEGGYPSEPRALSDAELESYTQGLELIGAGAAESLLLDTGPGGLAPAGADGAAEPGASLLPPRTEEPGMGKPTTAGDAAGQPPDVIERLGEVDVQFQRRERSTSNPSR